MTFGLDNIICVHFWLVYTGGKALPNRFERGLGSIRLSLRVYCLPKIMGLFVRGFSYMSTKQ